MKSVFSKVMKLDGRRGNVRDLRIPPPTIEGKDLPKPSPDDEEPLNMEDVEMFEPNYWLAVADDEASKEIKEGKDRPKPSPDDEEPQNVEDVEIFEPNYWQAGDEVSKEIKEFLSRDKTKLKQLSDQASDLFWDKYDEMLDEQDRLKWEEYNDDYDRRYVLREKTDHDAYIRGKRDDHERFHEEYYNNENMNTPSEKAENDDENGGGLDEGAKKS